MRPAAIQTSRNGPDFTDILSFASFPSRIDDVALTVGTRLGFADGCLDGRTVGGNVGMTTDASVDMEKLVAESIALLLTP